MKFLGSRTIETERLILKAQTMDEQEELWNILMMDDVNRYYLTVPIKFREKLKDWDKQKYFYESDMKRSFEKNIFRWSVFLKDNLECIGRVSCHEAHEEDNSINDPAIRGVGWYLNPKYQGLGYGKEAAKAMIDYMFLECEIDEIITGAAICNPSSWKIMENLGFERQKETKFIQYTYLDELTEVYSYAINREKYLLIHSKYKE